MISSVGNLQLFVGQLQLLAPPTFLTHDAAAAYVEYGGSPRQTRRSRVENAGEFSSQLPLVGVRRSVVSTT